MAVWVTVARLGNAASPSDYEPQRPPLRRFAASTVEVVLVDDDAARRAEAREAGHAWERDRSSGAPNPAYADWDAARVQERFRAFVARVRGRNSRAVTLRARVFGVHAEPHSDRVAASVSVIAIDQTGRELAAASGESILDGAVGGPFRENATEEIEAAASDAFTRTVVTDDFIARVNRSLDCQQCPPTPPAPPVVHLWNVREHEEDAAAHVVTAAFDAGKAYAYGLRYLHHHIHAGPGLFWGGYGIEGRLFSFNMERVDAAGALAVVHGGYGFEQSVSAEASVGVAGAGGKSQGLASFGLYYNLVYYLDLGFTAQFAFAPSSRPRWLAGPNFGVRINVPVYEHSKSLHCRSPAPCQWTGILPFDRIGK
jgi:hypothetical protein